MATIYGTNASQTINGTINADTIYAYGGSDLVYGGNGNDWIYGGAGDDDIFGGQGYNTLYGGTGYDWFGMTARSSSFSDDLIGDFQFGYDKIDVRAWGASDFSQIQALLTSDAYGDATLNAFYNGYNHRITVDGKSPASLIASDFIYNSTAGPKTVNGTNYNDVLFGGRSHDLLKGNSGNDTLLGGYGDDDLFGGIGNDVLVGGQGNDWMTGNAGYDVFDFNAVTDSTPNALRDRITDFMLDVDTINLATIDANVLAAGNQAFAFRGTGAFTAAGQVRFNFSGSDTIISINTDNDAAAEMQIALTGNKFLIRDDFVL